MAISKIIGAIHPPKSGGCYKILNNVINYILNPKKTVGDLYTGAINCTTTTVLRDFINTKEYYGKNSSNHRNRLAYHYVISFPPDANINEDKAFEVLKEFCEEYFGNEYEVVYALHNDQEHLHGHICFNSVSFMTGYKFRYEDGDWAKIIQPLLDKICLKYGINTLEMDTGVSIAEYEHMRLSNKKNTYYKRNNVDLNKDKNKKNTYYKESTQKFSKSDFVRADIDELILLSNNFEEFLKGLKNRGYDVRIGNSEKHEGGYLWVKNCDIKKRTYSLGADYEIEEIKRRILASNKPIPIYPEEKSYRFFIPVKILISKQQHTKLKEPAALKMYYSYLYRLGVKPHRKKSNYYEVKKLLSELENIERRLLLRDEHKIYSIDAADRQISQARQKLNVLQHRSKQLDKEIRRYRRILGVSENASGGKGNQNVEEYVAKIKRKLNDLNNAKKVVKTKLSDLIKIKEIMLDNSIYSPEQIEKDYEAFLNVIIEKNKIKKIK